MDKESRSSTAEAETRPQGIRSVRAETLTGTILMLLGATVAAGWLMHVPAMTEIRAGLVPMVFNTALGFLLTGAALAASGRPHGFAATMRLGIGILLVLLYGTTLVEFVLDIDLGIDMRQLHTWYDYGNTRPGRMAPNTATGFILIGAVILLKERVRYKRQAVAVIALTFLLLAVGLTGLVGYMLAPDLLFGWARSARMALHTATGMILASIGLWYSWSREEWYASQAHFQEDEKIRLLGSTILIIVTVTVGLVGFVLLQKSLERTLEDKLETSVRNRVAHFRATVDNRMRDAMAVVRLSGTEDAGRALLAQRTKQSEDSFASSGKTLVGEGYRGVALLDGSGKVLHTSGAFSTKPDMMFGLNPDQSFQLLWDGETILRLRLPVVAGEVRGTLVVDHAEPVLTRTIFDISDLGKTGETAACIRQNDGFLCLPGSRHERPFVARRSQPKAALPVEHGIAGQNGHVYAVDYRGKNVLAAYGVLVPGVGFVVKQDTTEVYEIIRAALGVGVPIILIIALLGTAFLYSQLEPLATKMRLSEQTASEKESEVRTIMEAAGDGMLTIDHRGCIQSVNAAACRIFGYEASELAGNSITKLMPADLRQAHQDGMTQLMAGRAPRLLGTPNIEVRGLRKDGTEFPLELTINQVPVSDKHLFIGIMRDITERKEVERKLSTLAQYDSLTGLPNRALFMDRLTTAVLRGRRAKSAMALMFLDLDGFKNINDTLGHQAGDDLLIQVSQRLASSVRKTDTVARLAGDEFTVILEELARPAEDAKAIAAKIIDAMRRPFAISGQEVTVTASIGMVLQEAGSEEVDIAEILHRADTEMYAAKSAGKNTVSMT